LQLWSRLVGGMRGGSRAELVGWVRGGPVGVIRGGIFGESRGGIFGGSRDELFGGFRITMRKRKLTVGGVWIRFKGVLVKVIFCTILFEIASENGTTGISNSMLRLGTKINTMKCPTSLEPMHTTFKAFWMTEIAQRHSASSFWRESI
jgi:hypothetical protein